MWAMQDKIALTLDEDKAIEFKSELAGGHERPVSNPALALPPKEFDPIGTEVARLKATLETWNGCAAHTDRL